jgi:putative photosynthetic complex assembly protein 2
MCGSPRPGEERAQMTFAAIGAAMVYTVLVWWLSTGAILWLDRLPRRTFRWSLIGASIIGVASFYGLLAIRGSETPVAAVVSFTCALGIWGWHELSFLTGLITGPRSADCPPEARGGLRFRLAAATLIYHEIALALTAVLLLGLTWGAPNQIGAWTFLVLLVSRLSAKFNIFLGVPNFTDSFFPDHLRYLATYLRKGPVNRLFPLSMAAGVIFAGTEAWRAGRAGASAFDAVGCALLFALTSLAVVEHVFMVLPIPDAALWRWALPASAKTNPGGALDL